VDNDRAERIDKNTTEMTAVKNSRKADTSSDEFLFCRSLFLAMKNGLKPANCLVSAVTEWIFSVVLLVI